MAMDVSVATDNSDRSLASVKRSELVKLIQLCPTRPYIELLVPSHFTSVERLTIVTLSHDQGFSSAEKSCHGTYIASHTWFEIVVISPSNHERTPPRVVQRNVHASREPKRHENTYDVYESDEETRTWLSTIRGNDTIQLVMRAEFPAWANFCYEAELKIVGNIARAGELRLQFDGLAITGHSSSFYQELKQPTREFRILRIHPGSFDEPISCTVRTLSLDDTGMEHYDALSYCWGDPHLNKTIKLFVQCPQTGAIEQHDVGLTSSLFNALRYLRPKDGQGKLLWVDFICINQSDIKERSSQVAMMPKIYSRAETVRIWLGTHTEASRHVFQAIHMIASRYENTNDTRIMSKDLDDIHDLHSPYVGQDVIPFVDSWRRCDFAWFKRTWIIQEVSNAKSAIVHCDRDTIPWFVILRLSDCIIKWKKKTSLSRHTIMPPIFSSIFRLGDGGATDFKRKDNSTGILDILIRGHDLEASDPRDKIFALLQFGAETWDVEQLPDLIKPDYSKSVVQTFVDFTRWWILTYKSLRILSAVHTTKYRGWERMYSTPPIDMSILGHPSWCFWYDGIASWAKATLALSEDIPYRATRDSVPDMELLIGNFQSRGLTVLSLFGYRLCTISSIEPYRLFGSTVEPEMQKLFVKIFDPIGDQKTWIWSREDQMVRVDRFRDQADMFGEHFASHFEHIKKTGGALPCYSPCYLRGNSDSKSNDRGGEIGLCPHNARTGDVIVLLHGGKVPYVLRRKNNRSPDSPVNSDTLGDNEMSGYSPDLYYFIGECYLQGHMDGVSFEKMAAGQKEPEVFHLV